VPLYRTKNVTITAVHYIGESSIPEINSILPKPFTCKKSVIFDGCIIYKDGLLQFSIEKSDWVVVSYKDMDVKKYSDEYFNRWFEIVGY